jgi:hypothetical protein
MEYNRVYYCARNTHIVGKQWDFSAFGGQDSVSFGHRSGASVYRTWNGFWVYYIGYWDRTPQDPRDCV